MAEQEDVLLTGGPSPEEMNEWLKDQHEPQQDDQGVIGTGGNATHGIEDIDTDPTPAEGTHIDENDVRQAISDTDGEIELAKHEFGRLADSVIRGAGVVKQSLTPKEPVSGWKTHGEKPVKQKPVKPMHRRGTPGDTGSNVDFTKLAKDQVFKK